jgi:fructose-1,6-bisphosphatase/inositol monophosphatase family enzyme
MNWETYLMELHFKIHNRVREILREKSVAELSTVAAQGPGDVSYAVDVQPEHIVDAYFSANPPEGGAVVLCEGLGARVYPSGITPEEAKYRILIDPLDGTREIMYDKRSCWILTGVALNKGEGTRMGDIFTCAQTEVPPSMQDRTAVLTARRGEGAFASIWDVPTGICLQPPRRMRTSEAKDLRHGFAVFVNFFPGMKEQISKIEESVLLTHLGPVEENKAATFTDQYISTAGQMFLLASGKYRMVADFRGRFGELMAAQGSKLSLCCHPYDLSTYLILTEAGGILTDAAGGPLNDPMDLDTNCSWFGYANQALYDALAPLLDREMNGLSRQVALKRNAEKVGLRRNDEVMETGEARFRTVLGDGSGMILCVNEGCGYWQNAHYHEHTVEIIYVQKGHVACIASEGGTERICLYAAGAHFALGKGLRHNVYMFPGSVTYTIKLTDGTQSDWHFAPELDARSKTLCEDDLLAGDQ